MSAHLTAGERETLAKSMKAVPGLKSEDVITEAVRTAAVEHLGTAFEAILTARLAAVEALADEMERGSCCGTCDARKLREALLTAATGEAQRAGSEVGRG